MFCYCRLAYMPMSYLYGRKFVGPITLLVEQLREEIHVQPYKEIRWSKTRHLCGEVDNYYPHGKLQKLLWDSVYYVAEPIINTWPFSKLREMAIERVINHIHYEDENSRYIDVGCVQKALMMLACWADDPNGEAFRKHIPRVTDYIWVAEDGITIQVCKFSIGLLLLYFNLIIQSYFQCGQSFGSQSWDCNFATRALLAANIDEDIAPVLKKAHNFLKGSQVRVNVPDHKDHFRHISKGAWTFSDRDHGWQVSDCTSS